MKTLWLIIVLACSASLVFAGGAKEAGRAPVSDLVSEGSFVAEVYIDEESYLDDYRFEYSPAEGAALSVFVDVDKPLVFHWGDVVTVQVAVTTNDKSFYPEAAFSYVLFFNDQDSLHDERAFSEVAAALRELLRTKTRTQRMFIFLQNDGLLEEIAGQTDIPGLLARAREQSKVTNPEKALQRMLAAGEAIGGPGPAKYLWILGKPVADSKSDIMDIAYLYAAYGSTTTEISFCGYDESFRPETVNRFVTKFGGNSYYISESRKLADVIRDDFAFYRRPAVSDLAVSVHAAGVSARREPVRRYTQRSMGPEEHHTFLVQLEVPSRDDYAALVVRKRYGEQVKVEAVQHPEVYPLAYVTYQYYNGVLDRMEYGARSVVVGYEDDYENYRLSQNVYVVKNMTIIGTARLLKNVSRLLLSRNFEEAIITIRDHVKTLENVNRWVDDPLITEDIATLNEYKILIAEHKQDPARGKIYYELRRRKH
ncbi:MAG: hypothetical protein ACOC8N_06170 [Spirochaetota bacterium]